MKNLLTILLMVFTVAAFSASDVKKIDECSLTSELFNANETPSFDQGWMATCYITIRNLETGETRRVYSVGSGATQSDALANCGRNARQTAQLLYGIQ